MQRRRDVGNRRFAEVLERRFEKQTNNGRWYLGLGLAKNVPTF
jgi:hypothetical protein